MIAFIRRIFRRRRYLDKPLGARLIRCHVVDATNYRRLK